MNKVFDIFKKKEFTKSRNKVIDFIFNLCFEDERAYIITADSKGKEIEVDYYHHTGTTREILKVIKKTNTDNQNIIKWDNSENRVWLDDHDYLLPLLVRSDMLFYKKKKITTSSDATLIMNLSDDNENIKSKIVCQTDTQNLDDFLMMTESFILKDENIFKVFPLGENYNRINLFNTEISKINIESFLSIFISAFDNVPINKEGFSMKRGNDVTPEPTIIIDSIDEDKRLFLKTGLSLNKFTSDFLDDFEITKVAHYNEEEKNIRIMSVDYQVFEDNNNFLIDLVKKTERELKLRKSFEVDENLVILESELAESFIAKHLAELLANFRILGTENLHKFKIKTSKPKLNLNLSSGINFLEGTAELEIDDEIMSVFDLLDSYKKNSFVQLNDGSKLIINKEYINKLQRIFKKKSSGEVKISFFDLPFVEDLIDDKISEDWAVKSRKIFEGFNSLSKKRMRKPKITGKLRDYQKQGCKWMKYLQDVNLGGCLADDMGLGKTVQTIAVLSEIYPEEQQQSLIVMPRSLLFNWAEEFAKFNPNISYEIYHGSLRNFNEEANLILTTYDIMRNDIQILKEKKFLYIILDESQKIKNTATKISKAVMLLDGKHRLALSGTPIENNLRELYSLFRFLNPAMFGSLKDFDKYYTMPIQKENDEVVMAELRKKIYPFILRRLKKDVVKDLPPKVEQTLYIEMDTAQKKYYEKRRSFYQESIKAQVGQNGIKKSQFFIFQALSELRQIATMPELKNEAIKTSAKKDALIEQIQDVAANNHKALIFSNYVGTLEILSEALNNSGIEHLVMTGSTRDRKTLIHRFQTDKEIKVFLMTLKTGGVGLNLTQADYVYILDPWWNVAAENQAIDRTHRIGQDKTVFSYKLITKDTIEEKILLLQEKKAELFDNIISSDGASVKFLSEDDIDYLLG